MAVIFDLDKIHGGLDVRWSGGRAAEAAGTATPATLDEKVGVIADERAVESLAGIDWAATPTAVSDDTRHIYVEAAEAAAGRSRRYNFSTDAGHRFERGVDPQLTVEHRAHHATHRRDLRHARDGLVPPLMTSR